MTNLADWLRAFLAATPEGRKALVEEAHFFLDANSIEAISVLKNQFDEDSYEELLVLIIQEVVPKEAALDSIVKLHPLITAYIQLMPPWLLRAADRVRNWALTAPIARRILK